tara:strand:- start:420 stop:605 length:186 start_codon:yes stop_codon:yes gene_type:complete
MNDKPKSKAKGMMNIFKKRTSRLKEENKRLREKIREIDELPVKKAMGGVMKNRGGTFKGTF